MKQVLKYITLNKFDLNRKHLDLSFIDAHYLFHIKLSRPNRELCYLLLKKIIHRFVFQLNWVG